MDGQRLHHALANPVRNRLLAAVRAADVPQDVHELADGVDVHINTVRSHLRILEDAGLVTSEPEERSRPGRPRLVYRPTEQASAVEEASPGYRFLATILAGYLSVSSADPAAAAESAGSAWGHHLVERPAPFETLSAETAIDRLVDVLDEFGFAPELDTAEPRQPRILLGRCPFLDVARDQPEVVCSIHLGLMRGALDELGVEVEATDLHPFVEPDLCVTDLQVPA